MVVNYLTGLRKNEMALREDSLPEDVELEFTDRTVLPTRDAVVRADNVANVGMRVLMTLTRVAGTVRGDGQY
jgi:outer membrane usher protein